MTELKAVPVTKYSYSRGPYSSLQDRHKLRKARGNCSAKQSEARARTAMTMGDCHKNVSAQHKL